MDRSKSWYVSKMYSLGIYEIKQQGYYTFIPGIQWGGAIPEEFGDLRDLLQLDNGLALRNLKAQHHCLKHI